MIGKIIRPRFIHSRCDTKNVYLRGSRHTIVVSSGWKIEVWPKLYCLLAVTRRWQMEKSPSNRSGNKSSVNLGHIRSNLLNFHVHLTYIRTRKLNVADNNNIFVVASQISFHLRLFSSKLFRTLFIFRPYLSSTQLMPQTNHSHVEGIRRVPDEKIGEGDDIIKQNNNNTNNTVVYNINLLRAIK